MKIHSLISIVLLFVLSLLHLFAAYVLQMSDKSATLPFLVGLAQAILFAVIGSNGKVSLRDVIAALKNLRK
ncbi:hypothetical protein [Lysobacter capsici]|uniref:hypothetical protein n=1 Tax=Lysobacter capsici TaxID=435897 RepID=UPI0012FD5805|nr:hypothetical protein [Lysobacter capsici]